MKIENENYRNDGKIRVRGKKWKFVFEANENVAMKFHLIVLDILSIFLLELRYIQSWTQK